LRSSELAKLLTFFPIMVKLEFVIAARVLLLLSLQSSPLLQDFLQSAPEWVDCWLFSASSEFCPRKTLASFMLESDETEKLFRLEFLLK